MAIGEDGPGYYKAREAIEMLKNSEYQNKTQAANIRIEVEDEENSIILFGG